MPTETAATWPCSGFARMRPPAHELLAGLRERDVAAGDGGGARAAVGLQHVAVERDGALTERAQVGDRAQRAADEALDLLGAPALLAARRLARRARVGRARQHAVLGGNPALALAAQEGRHAVLDARRAQHLGVTEFNEHRAFGVLGEAAREAHVAQLIRGASRGSGHRPSPRASAVRPRRCCRSRCRRPSRRAPRGRAASRAGRRACRARSRSPRP